ncbi:MAG: DUF362 domain-containing protein [Candidatus Omnitrophica bacterium]|nr:DUF362 domain-containing protein [Candidatus Omnitrophota bacterium]MBU1924814.1 DUF362 domain-containing protein [Candidatus Omnitrophota bacterium]
MSTVSLVRCADYNFQQTYKAVKAAIGLVGGIDKFVLPGQKVLIKPNLLRAARPDEAVTTHPEFVRAVIRVFKEKETQIFVGDSPAGLVKIDAVYEKCGITQVCREEKVNLVKFDRIIEINGIPFAELLRQVDVCVSLPKFKTHNLTTITAGVKNVFGFIPGLYKVYCHKQAPNHREFSSLIAKIYGMVRPHLTILDAIEAMDGDGPSSGRPIKIGLVLAASDAVALDSVISKIVGLNAGDVVSTREAYKLGLGEADIAKINIVGEKIGEVLAAGFKPPRIAKLFKLPNIISRTILKVIPLVIGIDRKRCNLCFMCKNSCPQQAIILASDKLSINPQRCILCFCCGEVCPNNAIYIRFLNRRRQE